MSTWVRHAVSILLLPFMVVVAVPLWLRRAFPPGVLSATGQPVPLWLHRPAGLLLFVAGLLLFGWCVLLFARVGRGTLAPWDPTRSLVAAGPYRFVRNPMISGVALMLLGQTVFWLSGPLAIWAGLFILVNHLYFVLSEEPGLERRFGDDYRAYKASVPRWLPRIRSGFDE